jgi:hypothetical protein
MSGEKWRDQIVPVVRVQQIIVAGLVGGCLSFLALAVGMRLQGAMPQGDPVPELSYVLVLFAVTALAARAIVPGMIVARSRRAIARGTWRLPEGPRRGTPIGGLLGSDTDEAKLAAVSQTVMIVSAALLEGVAFFGLIVYLIQGDLAALVIAVLMILGVAAHFPTRSRVVAWIENQLAMLSQERQFKGR